MTKTAYSGSWQQRMKVRGEKGARSQQMVGGPARARRGRILGHAQAPMRPRRIDAPNLFGGETHQRKGQIAAR